MNLNLTNMTAAKMALGFTCSCAFLLSFSQTTGNTVDYFNQQPPRDSPTLFAPGIFSDGYSNRDFTISPKGNEIYFTLQQQTLVSVILYTVKQAGKWSTPQVAPISGRYNDLEATFTADGKQIFFSSNRPINESDTTDDYNIWTVNRAGDRWSGPVPLDSTVNTEKDEFYPSLARNGNLYFTTQLETGKGKEDIVVCKWENGKYQPPVSLPASINSAGYEFNAFVDPDEQFLIYTAYGRADDAGRGDLYISRRSNGEWQPATNLGKLVNSASIDYCPYVSPDHKYFFFTSSRATFRQPFEQPWNAARIRKGLASPGNGFDDIYWMRFDHILPSHQ
jgi:Tol biopolymer transport system component